MSHRCCSFSLFIMKFVHLGTQIKHDVKKSYYEASLKWLVPIAALLTFWRSSSKLLRSDFKMTIVPIAAYGDTGKYTTQMYTVFRKSDTCTFVFPLFLTVFGEKNLRNLQLMSVSEYVNWWHLDWCSYFSTPRDCHQQTRPRYISNSWPHLCTVCMPCGLKSKLVVGHHFEQLSAIANWPTPRSHAVARATITTSVINNSGRA